MEILDSKYEDYLSDESKLKGKADTISFPENIDEISSILKLCNESGISVTIQGARTGLSGGAVPFGGHVLNLSKMNHVLSFAEDSSGTVVKVEAGVTLDQLEKYLLSGSKTKAYSWIPSPTESLATIGGVIASNAKGINSYYYGDTANYVRSVNLVVANGEIKTISRESDPELFKLVTGSEGVIGVIAEAELILTREMLENWGICFFFEDKCCSWQCIDQIKKMKSEPFAHIKAVEYFDQKTIQMIMEQKSTMTKLQSIPDIDGKFAAMIYIELEGEEGLEDIAEQLMELTMEYGSNPDETWALEGKTEMEKMKIFRHAAPEIIGLFFEKVKQNDSRLYKMIGDYKITELSFEELMNLYQKIGQQSGIPYCVFGHAASNHVLLHLLPKNFEELNKSECILRTTSEFVSRLGAQFPGEQGVGKTKRKYLVEDSQYKQLLEYKEKIDPKNILNQGNIVE